MGNGLTRSTLYLVCALENKGKNNEFFKSAVWKENSLNFSKLKQGCLDLSIIIIPRINGDKSSKDMF